MEKNFYKNLKYAFIAQFISILFSLIMYLIVPKVVGTVNYAYWQLFMFYTNYSGFFHLGLVDGIYLRLGGKKYSDLNYELLGSQLKVMTLFQTILTILLFIIFFNINIAIDRKIVFFWTAIFTIIYCIENYLGFILQAVNLTKKYSFAIITEKVICLVITVILLILHIENYKLYIATFTISKLINVVILIFQCRKIVFSKILKFKIVFKEMASNITVGSILMFSGIAGSLIIGNGRMVIDNIWGIETFGKISFSISMLNMVLLFVKQISMVLFPALKTIEEEQQSDIYYKTRKELYILLPIIYLCYIPGKYIMNKWLPQYGESLIILSLTMPICIYDAKMQILGNTYFKLLRKEKRLLIINILTMIISLVLSVFVGYLLKSVNLIVISLVFAIAIRSIYAELYLNKYYKQRKNEKFEIIAECIISITFMTASWYLRDVQSLLVVVFSYVIFICINKDDSKYVYNILKNKLKRENKNET